MTVQRYFNKQPKGKLTPRSIIIFYLLAGGAWIFLSDRILAALITDSSTLSNLQTYKGWFFIIITASLLYYLIRRYTLAQQEAEKQITGNLERITDGFISLDKDWRFTYVNKKAGELFGRDPADMIDRHIWAEFPEGIGQPFYDTYRNAMADQVSVQKEEYYAPWGRWFECRIYPSREGISIFLKDITEQKQAEEAFHKSEQHYQAIVNSTRDVIFILSPEGLITELNPAFETTTGWSSAEWLGRHFESLVHPGDLALAFEKFREALQGRVPPVFELRLRSGSGEYLVFEFASTPQFRDGKVRDVMGVARNITGRRSIEEENRLLASTVRYIPDAICSINPEGTILSWNKGAEKMLGYKEEEILGKHISVTIPKELAREELQHLVGILNAEGFLSGYESVRITKGGIMVPVEITAAALRDAQQNIVNYTAIMRDITERKKLEAQLIQAQKMEAVGQLAGGVAHDFNNILSAIIGYGSLLQMKMAADDPLKVNVAQILESADKAAQLTRSLLAFGRKQIMSMKHLDLNEVIRKVESLLVRVIGADIDFGTCLEKTGLTVMADSGQIEQVLMNLATNARDAMPQGGALAIRTEKNELDAEFIKVHGYGKTGAYAVISVADTGSGMTEETRQRIFEPFFTTKETGKGTGLGLAIVYGIVKQHDGYITVSSEPGQGTTFRIYLPLLRAAAKEEEKEEAVRYPSGGTETVLIAEDDEALRRLSDSVLKEFGYSVILAADGEDAVAKFKGNVDRIDLLILDMVMPHKNGKEAYEEIRKIRPDVKALFASGYAADIIRKEGILDEGLDFIVKPVSPMELLRKVREILDRKQ